MGEIKVERLTADQIAEMQADAARGFRGKVPVHRVESEPPEQLRLTVEVEGGFVAAFADVCGAIEVPHITPYQRYTDCPDQFPKIETEWELMCQVPNLLGKVVVGGLRIGKTIRLPVNGVMMDFKISVQYPKL